MAELPTITPVTDWPPEVQAALMELVAFTVNQGSLQMMFALRDLQAEGRRFGDYEVTIRKIDS